GPGSLDEFSPRWPEVLAAVRSRNVLVQALLLDAQPSDLEAGRVTLSFQHGLHCERIQEQQNLALVQDAIFQVFDVRLAVACKVAPEAFERPARTRPEDHPVVRAVLREVGGEITGVVGRGEGD
ncbi:MAG: hypothetical protein ACYC9D_06105, partial [Candidatus Dormibacteria bacterium]